MISKADIEYQFARNNTKWWDTALLRVGQENYYYDKEGCRKGIVTVDRDAGVTPAQIPCQTKGCNGVMTSRNYPSSQSKPAWLGGPTHEWYRPDEIDDDDEEDDTTDHLLRAGLLLREVTNADQA